MIFMIIYALSASNYSVHGQRIARDSHVVALISIGGTNCSETFLAMFQLRFTVVYTLPSTTACHLFHLLETLCCALISIYFGRKDKIFMQN